MLLKYCTQYASKFGKFSSGHRTGKGQSSFQSQRKAMPKTVQTTIQLCSFHMLARQCSKSFKPGSNTTWTNNFQMYKLGLEKAEEASWCLPQAVFLHCIERGGRVNPPHIHLSPGRPFTWSALWMGRHAKKKKEKSEESEIKLPAPIGS